jgi:hypothetical protein
LNVDKEGFIWGSVADASSGPYPPNGKNIIITFNKTKRTDSLIAPWKMLTSSTLTSISGGKYIVTGANEVCITGHGVFSSRKSKFSPISSFIDPSNKVWVGCRKKGVSCYSISGLNENESAHYLDGLSVSCTTRDNEGGYWFTTLENGVYYMSSGDLLYYDTPDGFLANKVLTVCPRDSSSVWAGTSDGIIEIAEKDKLLHFKDQGARGPENSIYRLQEGSNKTLLVGSASSYIESLKGMPLKESPGSIRLINPKVAIKCFATNKKGSLWGGNYLYLEKIDPISGKVLLVTKTKSRILSIYCDDQDVVWLGCIDGLLKYKDNTFYNMGDSLALFKNRVEDIKIAPDGTWWFATKGDGLVAKKGTHINHLTQKTGLTGNSCSSLFIDEQGIIWVGTSKGISKVVRTGPDSFNYERYSATEGLQSDEINQIVKSGNYLWAATNQGILFFNANTHITNSCAPPVYLTDITAGFKKQKAGTYLNLKYSQNHIQLSFVGLSYKGNTKARYKYILEGLDTSWNYTQNTSIQYTTLPPGDYRFIVYALNCSGVQSGQPAMLHFLINKPFWLEKWFIFILALLILGVTFLLYTLRIRTIKKRIFEKEEISRKMIEMELKALRAQMNPHFIFNCISSIQHFILKNDTESADNYLSSFAQLIRSVLTYSRYEFIPVETEIEMLELYLHLESMRFSSKFSFKVRAHVDLDITNLCLPPMVIQPYVENAIWHGLMHLIDKKAELTILFEQIDGHLKCIVEDNGIGRAKSRQQKVQSKHQSLGLSITSERFEYMNSLYRSSLSVTIVDKTDAEGKPCGTRVELLLPIKTNIHPKPLI